MFRATGSHRGSSLPWAPCVIQNPNGSSSTGPVRGRNVHLSSKSGLKVDDVHANFASPHPYDSSLEKYVLDALKHRETGGGPT